MMKISSELKGITSVGITGHIKADGDCIGSTLAMYLFIKKNMPEIDVHVFLEAAPKVFNCLKGFDCIEDASVCNREFDCFICIDSVKDRTGEAEKLYDKAKKTINIDHHVTNMGCGDVNYIVPDASSASELVYDVLDIDKIDKDIAAALYIGIVHDTGIFHYSNVSSKTMRIGASLLEYDFDFSKLIDITFCEKSYTQQKILGRVLSESGLMSNGRISVGHVSLETMSEFGAISADMDGIVNQLLYIKGVGVAIFMYAVDENIYKVSMRSNTDELNVAKVASLFGGGGHVRAAGVTMQGNYNEITEKLIVEIEKQYV